MATKDQAYDSPLYQVRNFFGGTFSGASGRFSICAAQAMIVKSASILVEVAGTAADTLIAYKQTGTTTSTILTITTNTAATGVLTNATPTCTLAQGDSFYFVKGSDATARYSVGIETVLVPGTTVTV
jgi:hypothetical protein